MQSWEEEDATEEWADEVHPPPAKRPTPPSEAPTLAHLVEHAVARGLAAAGAAQSSSSSSAAAQLMLPPPPPPSQHQVARTNQDFVTIPRSQIASILDHCDRAEQAARQAARIANSAALAFDAEAGHIAAAKSSILSILNQWQ